MFRMLLQLLSGGALQRNYHEGQGGLFSAPRDVVPHIKRLKAKWPEGADLTGLVSRLVNEYWAKHTTSEREGFLEGYWESRHCWKLGGPYRIRARSFDPWGEARPALLEVLPGLNPNFQNRGEWLAVLSKIAGSSLSYQKPEEEAGPLMDRFAKMIADSEKIRFYEQLTRSGISVVQRTAQQRLQNLRSAPACVPA